jgi:cAMP-dependent protein kinase regulator
LEKAFMFSALENKDKDIVINAMAETIVKEGEFIIKQGDDGDNLFVIESGQLDCTKYMVNLTIL